MSNESVSETHKGHQLSTYFRKAPTTLPARILAAFGLLSLVTMAPLGRIGLEGTSLFFTFFWFGLAFCAALPRLLHSQDCPSDEQVDQWLTEDLEQLLINDQKDILDRLGLIEDQLQQEPLLTYAPFLDFTDFVDPRVRLGEDGKYRFSAHQLLVLTLADHHLHVYVCIYDSIERRSVFLETREYSYNDMVSVQSTNVVEMLEVGKPKTKKVWLQIHPATAGLAEMLKPEKIPVPRQMATITFVSGESLDVPVNVTATVTSSKPLPSAPSLDRLLELLRMLYRGKKEQMSGSVAA